MAGIKERLKIYRKDNEIVYEEEKTVLLNYQQDTKVSMNFFCYDSTFIDLCEEQFQKFLR